MISLMSSFQSFGSRSSHEERGLKFMAVEILFNSIYTSLLA